MTLNAMNTKIQLGDKFRMKDIQFLPAPGGIGVDYKGKPWVKFAAYVDSRAIQNRLDEVFGWDGWEEEYTTNQKGVICTLKLYSEKHGRFIEKSDGAPFDGGDLEYKGAISNALKRTVVKFGIGRYLYDLPTLWGKSCTKEKPEDHKNWIRVYYKKQDLEFWCKTPEFPAEFLHPEDLKEREEANKSFNKTFPELEEEPQEIRSTGKHWQPEDLQEEEQGQGQQPKKDDKMQKIKATRWPVGRDKGKPVDEVYFNNLGTIEWVMSRKDGFEDIKNMIKYLDKVSGQTWEERKAAGSKQKEIQKFIREEREDYFHHIHS